MSLILEALNKADRSREGSVGPTDLSATHAQPMPQLLPLWSIWVGLLFLAVITLAIVVLVWRLLAPPALTDRDLVAPVVFNPLPEVATPVKSPATEIAVAAFKPLRSPNLDVDKPSVAPEIAEIYGMANDTMASLYAESAAADQNFAPALVTYEMITQDVTTHRPVAEEQASVESISTAPPAVVVRSAKNKGHLPSPEELQRMWEQTKSQVESKKASVPATVPTSIYAKIPYLYELPENFQRRIPSLLYQNHIYSAKGSAVILNGKTYRKNDPIAPDLVVVDITEDDLILDYLKRPFKLAALSSWVQMD
ncbi:MAG: general secretion pathway protein GspB [Marinagarivorans sp.]|nr:general secretion pathway protein GspB [Marinagarivorans sp.]